MTYRTQRQQAGGLSPGFQETLAAFQAGLQVRGLNEAERRGQQTLGLERERLDLARTGSAAQQSMQQRQLDIQQGLALRQQLDQGGRSLPPETKAAMEAAYSRFMLGQQAAGNGAAVANGPASAAGPPAPGSIERRDLLIRSGMSKGQADAIVGIEKTRAAIAAREGVGQSFDQRAAALAARYAGQRIQAPLTPLPRDAQQQADNQYYGSLDALHAELQSAQQLVAGRQRNVEHWRREVQRYTTPEMRGPAEQALRIAEGTLFDAQSHADQVQQTIGVQTADRYLRPNQEGVELSARLPLARQMAEAALRRANITPENSPGTPPPTAQGAAGAQAATAGAQAAAAAQAARPPVTEGFDTTRPEGQAEYQDFRRLIGDVAPDAAQAIATNNNKALEVVADRIEGLLVAAQGNQDVRDRLRRGMLTGYGDIVNPSGGWKPGKDEAARAFNGAKARILYALGFTPAPPSGTQVPLAAVPDSMPGRWKTPWTTTPPGWVEQAAFVTGINRTPPEPKQQPDSGFLEWQ